MYTVFVEDLEFYAYHGVSSEEQKVGHRFAADIRLEVEGSADRSDRIEDTVSYADIALAVVELAKRKPHRTVERLAGLIADELLKRHKLIETVWIRIAKRLPPVDLVAEYVGVELERSRT